MFARRAFGATLSLLSFGNSAPITWLARLARAADYRRTLQAEYPVNKPLVHV